MQAGGAVADGAVDPSANAPWVAVCGSRDVEDENTWRIKMLSSIEMFAAPWPVNSPARPACSQLRKVSADTAQWNRPPASPPHEIKPCIQVATCPMKPGSSLGS